MLEHLKRLRTDWSDQIPKEIVHSDAPDNQYKVRRNWFTGVVADVANLLDEGEITDLARQTAAKQLIASFTSEEFINRDLTTIEDIQTANSLIDIILGE